MLLDVARIMNWTSAVYVGDTSKGQCSDADDDTPSGNCDVCSFRYLAIETTASV